MNYHTKGGHAVIVEPLLDIKVEQVKPDCFTVTYGLQVKPNLNYVQAAHEFGLCTFHALACAGKLDYPAGKEYAASTCDDCGQDCEQVIGCPDGAEVCQACFDAGNH